MSNRSSGEGLYAERYRILVDLDGDGHKDMILSTPMEIFGKAGGQWSVFLKREGAWKAVGDLSARPFAIAIEPDQSHSYKNPAKRRHSRIWTYNRASGSSGLLGYYRVGEDAVDDFKCFEIYPGDGGSAIGRAIYKAVFTDQRDQLDLEVSQTSKTGKVSWKSAN